jgi:hypothetical protein
MTTEQKPLGSGFGTQTLTRSQGSTPLEYGPADLRQLSGPTWNTCIRVE